MQEDNDFPFITTMFDLKNTGSNNVYYRRIIESTLKKILPIRLFQQKRDEEESAENRDEFVSLLPFITSTPCETTPANISFYMVSNYRGNAFKFFFDMISHWLIPGKRLNVILLYAADFQVPAFGKDLYTLCEVIINLESQSDLDIVQQNLPIIETEIRLGIESSYYAQRILEIKGLSADAKTAMIQEYISMLISRSPKVFDYDVLTEMQHVLVMCRDEFKGVRECRHLSRIIAMQYLFRKEVREAVKVAPTQRHLKLKLFKTTLNAHGEEKAVLAVVVGINFLRDNEIFEERHLLGAIQNYIPLAKVVENSFFANRRGTEQICTLYLEIEKSNDEFFSTEEIHTLRQELPSDLKDRIEHLMHPVFMPRNEEEIMRNILSLSNQIKYLHDLPQIIISFDEQTHTDLFFTVILVMVVKPGCLAIEELFKKSGSFLVCIPDRSKTLGVLRKKYAKEATVFRVMLSKGQFLRRDHSIDLNKARQTVASELVKVLGEYRDFNGGMITKQNELLCCVRELLNNDVKYNELLLENFFYSLTPDVMRTVLDPESLKILFVMLLESIDEGLFTGDHCSLKVKREPNCVFAVIKGGNRSVKEEISQALLPLHQKPNSYASFSVQVYGIPYYGYLCINEDIVVQNLFVEALQGKETLGTLKDRR